MFGYKNVCLNRYAALYSNVDLITSQLMCPVMCYEKHTFSLDVFGKTSADRFVKRDLMLHVQYFSEHDHVHVGVAIRFQKYNFCDFLYKYYDR